MSSKSQATHSAAGGRPELPHTTQSNESNWAIFGASTENNDPTTPDTNTSKPSTKKTASEAAMDINVVNVNQPNTSTYQ